MNARPVYIDKVANQCEKLLYALVITLVFEGILRKVLPSAFSIGLFFVKDLMCIYGIQILLKKKLTGLEERISYMWRVLFGAFIPLILYTGFFDVKLSLFGPKQYLLFIITALLVPTAFPAYKVNEFKKFFAFLAFLLVPTTLVAIVQISLPSSHWLNQGVGGSNLQGFSAGGYLRVSSTFSFTGQFSWFLNSACVFFAIRFFLPPTYTNRNMRSIDKYMPYLLVLMLIIGAFITGGRSAVLGCGACMLLGVLLSGFKRPQWVFSKGILMGLFVAFGITVISAVKPEFFAAYTARSQGTETTSHSEEIGERLLSEFVGWTSWFNKQELVSMLLGNGLGVMSNGSDQISSYSQGIRADGFWTETDMATTLWEGGLYLAFIWYGFRLSIIVFCLRIWRSLTNTSHILASSFLMSYIIIIGVNGTLGIQPPVAIWWFLCVGSMITIKNLEIKRKVSDQQHRQSLVNFNAEINS